MQIGIQGSRRGRALILACGIVLATLGAVASPAAAVDCDPDVDCMGTVYWNVAHPSGFRGAKVTLRSNCMIVASLSGQYVAHYLEARLSPYSLYYMQIGVRLGALPGGGRIGSPNRYISWNKPFGFDIWTLGIESMNTGRVATIWAPPGSVNDWELWFDNTQSHYHSTNNFTAPARSLTAGTGLRDDPLHRTRTYGSVSRLYFYNLGGAITSQWSGSTSAQLSESPGMNVTWASTNWWARMGNTTC